MKNNISIGDYKGEKFNNVFVCPSAFVFTDGKSMSDLPIEIIAEIMKHRKHANIYWQKN